MLPGIVVSEYPVAAPFLAPDGQRTKTEDFESGGVAVQDTSQGLDGYTWRAWVEDDGVHLQRAGAAGVLWMAAADVTELALAFDQAMRPLIAYAMQDGILRLRWYDTASAAYGTSQFGPGKNPRLTLDDKRMAQSGASDVIFAYRRDDGLYYRAQRDRYQIEYTVAAGIDYRLELFDVGMTTNNRLCFSLVQSI